MSDLASALLLCLEGFRTKAYQDSGGVWTIGAGHTKGVKGGDTCTVEQGMAWLASDAALLYSLVANLDPISQAAYISFGYNCGIHNLEAVLSKIGNISDLVHTTDRHGVVQPGLVARRNLEIALLNLVERKD